MRHLVAVNCALACRAIAPDAAARDNWRPAHECCAVVPRASPSESFLLSRRLVFTRCPGAVGTIEGDTTKQGMLARRQFVVETKTGRPGFVNKGHSLPRKMLAT